MTVPLHLLDCAINLRKELVPKSPSRATLFFRVGQWTLASSYNAAPGTSYLSTASGAWASQKEKIAYTERQNIWRVLYRQVESLMKRSSRGSEGGTRRPKKSKEDKVKAFASAKLGKVFAGSHIEVNSGLGYLHSHWSRYRE